VEAKCFYDIDTRTMTLYVVGRTGVELANSETWALKGEWVKVEEGDTTPCVYREPKYGRSHDSLLVTEALRQEWHISRSDERESLERQLSQAQRDHLDDLRLLIRKGI
jgi:hypothetical protein